MQQQFKNDYIFLQTILWYVTNPRARIFLHNLISSCFVSFCCPVDEDIVVEETGKWISYQLDILLIWRCLYNIVSRLILLTSIIFHFTCRWPSGQIRWSYVCSVPKICWIAYHWPIDSRPMTLPMMVYFRSDTTTKHGYQDLTTWHLTQG